MSSTAPPPQPESPAKRLRAMADEMADIAAELDYFGGFSKKSQAGRDLADICILIHQVSADIEAENHPK
ncbi:hypothetical protein [Pandoraea apista]|uniref:hypothetical protein n=1 Tax=Pandoraea apista TaxID=93218 RepID=UPI001EE6162A|nr:hypothetical protein [Pandoraea apista]